MDTRSLTLAWVALVGLSVLSVQAADQAHAGLGRLLMTLLVALLAWGKGMIVVRQFLESHRAGPLIHRIVMAFTLLAPLGLVASGLREFLRSV